MKFSEKNFWDKIRYKDKEVQEYDMKKRTASSKTFLENDKLKEYSWNKQKENIKKNLPKDYALKVLEKVDEVNMWTYSKA